jgi:hypothetical protein
MEGLFIQVAEKMERFELKCTAQPRMRSGPKRLYYAVETPNSSQRISKPIQAINLLESDLQSVDLLLKLGKIVLDNLPYNFEVHTKVVVNNSVT